MLQLDTDTVVELLKANPKAQHAYDAVPPGTSVAISSITAAELYFGAANSSDPPARTREVAALLTRLSVIPVDEAVAAGFGVLKAQLRAAGQIIPDFDLLIAATAFAHGRTVVTHNTRHFARIPGLTVIDWLA
jgi:tRNA(fMet)-specific endonuclease VapC